MSEVPNPPVTPEDYKVAYEAEAAKLVAETAKNADLIQQRNLLKPAQRMLNNLSPEDREAFIRAAELRGTGDMEGLQEWLESSLEGITGKSVADLIAARQKAEQATPDDAAKPAPGLTEEQVQAIVERSTTLAREAERGERRVAEELEARGYKMGSASGQTIINHAVGNKISLGEAADWYENDITTTVLEKQKAAAAAAALVPGAAPNGTAAGAIPDYDPKLSPEANRRISITARLTNGVTR